MGTLVFAIVLSIGAQAAAPNTAPSTATKSGSSIGHFGAKQKARETKQADPAEPQVLPCNQTSPCYVIDQPQARTKEEQAKADSLDTLTRCYMWATIIGVFGGLIGVGILIWQTILVRRSANAALLNAQYVVNSERAWVLLNSPELSEKFDPYSDRAGYLPVSPAIVNHGRTVAQLNSYSIRSHKILKDQGLPKEPEYTDRKPLIITVPPNSPIYPIRIYIPPADRPLIEKGEFLLFIYGFVEYFDLGEERRETRFCFQYVPEGILGQKRGWYISSAMPEIYSRCT